MLYFNRIDVSEGIDGNKTSALKEYDICHYWYFLKYSLSFNQMFLNFLNIKNGVINLI